MSNVQHWIISAPNSNAPKDKAKAQAQPKMKDFSNKVYNRLQEISDDVNVLEMPPLRTGTIDSLMSLGDDLPKIEMHVEGLLRKMETQQKALESSRNADPKSKRSDADSVRDAYENALTREFQWKHDRYDLKTPLRDIVDKIVKECSGIEDELRAKSANWQTVKANLAMLERQEGGNLMIKSLHGIVKASDVLQDSQELKTAFVVVPKNSEREWTENYAKLAAGCKPQKSTEEEQADAELKQIIDKMASEGRAPPPKKQHANFDIWAADINPVVPGSNIKLAEDNEYILFSVIVLTRFLETFKVRCRERKFTVRDFVYDPEAVEANRTERQGLAAESSRHLNQMTTWCQTNRAEVISALTHIKSIRTFVESVLRYGVPADFTIFVIRVLNKNEKKVRTGLAQIFGELGGAKYATTAQEAEAASSAGALNADFYPYVYVQGHLNE
eukprot:GFYU01002776.1.p1 GENE.GFYU01002776.1~~GFYU01002776.1.p1  ORF type:complete len:444 (+),score=143.98 GFYU01002776.1:138-1469(+)